MQNNDRSRDGSSLQNGKTIVDFLYGARLGGRMVSIMCNLSAGLIKDVQCGEMFAFKR